LVPNGIVTKETWDVLKNPEELSSTGMATPIGPSPTIRYGDSGTAVENLQGILKSLLYYSGSVTGVFDTETLLSVKAFQSMNNLIPDGVVGKNTWAVLYASKPPDVNC